MRQISVYLLAAIVASGVTASCSGSPGASDAQASADSFLIDFNDQYASVTNSYREAQWQFQTHISSGESEQRAEFERAELERSRFLGDAAQADTANALLANSNQLRDDQVRQLKQILLLAAANSQAGTGTGRARASKEADAAAHFNGFSYRLGDDEIAQSDLSRMLYMERDLDRRALAWNALMSVGEGQCEALGELVHLRNASVADYGFDDFFAYNAANYDLSSDDVVQHTRQLVKDVWPMYRELHTWARYELARRYQVEVPTDIPAHMLPQMFGQLWAPLLPLRGLHIDTALEERGASWMVEQSEAFYVSLGFDPLPRSFWENSDMYPREAGSEFKKNAHASAWHVNLAQDVRILANFVPRQNDWITAHHELGHIYYFLAYSHPDVPPVLRQGANRAMHEAFGTILGVVASHPNYLKARGVIDADVAADENQQLLQQALGGVPLLIFAAGPMTEFEHQIYTGQITPAEYQDAWWSLVRQYQGVARPSARPLNACDAAAKYHIMQDPGQYFDYAFSIALGSQFHRHVAENILHQTPHNTDYYGNEKIGVLLKQLMAPGATEDWESLLSRHLGEGMSAEAFVEYFAPVLPYLRELNDGRVHTLPETPF